MRHMYVAEKKMLGLRKRGGGESKEMRERWRDILEPVEVGRVALVLRIRDVCKR